MSFAGILLATLMASIAGLYGGNFGANQEDGSGGRVGFFGGLRSAAAAAKKGAISDQKLQHQQGGPLGQGGGGQNAAGTLGPHGTDLYANE